RSVESFSLSESPKRPTGGRYPAGTRVDSYVFLSTTFGVDPETGELPRNVALSDLEGRIDTTLLSTSRQRQIAAETERAFQNLEDALEVADASLESIVHMNGWVYMPMREYGAVVLM